MNTATNGSLPQDYPKTRSRTAELRYGTPADKWTDALPIGNGRIGAMCFGGVAVDRFQLNEDSCWSGSPASEGGGIGLRVDGPQTLERIRAALAADDQDAAEAAAQQLQSGHSQSYQPVADLIVVEPDIEDSTQEYERWLDLGEAVAGHQWRDHKDGREQEAFVSAPAGVLVIRRRALQGNAMNLNVSLAACHALATSSAAGHGQVLTQRLPSDVVPPHEDSDDPVRYDQTPGSSGTVVTSFRVVTDGTIEASDSGVAITAANDVLLLVAVSTDIDDATSRPHGDAKRLAERNDAAIDAAIATGFDSLRREHVADHRALFDRAFIEMDAPADAEEIYTDVRVRRAAERGDDPALASLLVDYGRYLMISASRPGTHPMNLQGIWSELRRPVWSSNYTTNINVEMNHWLAHPGNLSECSEPLREWVKVLARRGAGAARDLYGADGWVAHHNSDIWGYALPAGEGHGDPCWSMWPMAGPWLTMHLWEDWTFSRDARILADVWPLMRGAAEFCLSWLVTDADGNLQTVPSTSPENKFLRPDGREATLSVSATSDVVLLRELFRHCIEAIDILGIPADGLAPRLIDALDRLPELRVLPDGRFAEWSHDLPDADPLHRHQSHLIGIHPGTEVDIDLRPDLADAARATLLARGPKSTGWSLAWRLSLHARLRNPSGASRAIGAFLTPMASGASDEPSMTAPSGVYRNLFSAHPPFQIDGNMGFAAGAIELLVQSHQSRIEILPCLPSEWATGRAIGLRARPGVTVDLKWEDGTLVWAALEADETRVVTVVLGGSRRTVHLAGGERVVLDGRLETVATPAASGESVPSHGGSR